MEWRNELGELHRVGGPAVIWGSGRQMWYQDGLLHRTDGPAIIGWQCQQLWYVKGKLHRTDGPAVEHADGTREWWLDGVQVDQLEHWLLVSTKETV